jgi:hypothetical protein
MPAGFGRKTNIGGQQTLPQQPKEPLERLLSAGFPPKTNPKTLCGIRPRKKCDGAIHSGDKQTTASPGRTQRGLASPSPLPRQTGLALVLR